MVAETETATAGWERPLPLAGAREFASRHALLLIVAVGATIRFATLGSQGFWIDEYVQTLTLRHPPSELLPTVMNSETQPVLYLVVGKAWQAVFGLGEVGLRSLSALAGTATIPVVYWAGRALGSRRTGLFAAALTATSPFMIWYSQEARPYALFAFFSALSFLFFVQALQGRGMRWLWAWAIASVLAFSTHYFGFLLTGIEAVWLLWALRGSRQDVALSIGAIAVASVPLMLLGLTQQHFTSWIELVSRPDRLLQVPQHLIVGLSSPWPILGPLLVGTVLAVVLYVIVKSNGEALRAVAIPAGVAFAVAAVTLIAMAAGSDYLVTRNLIGIFAPFVIALGALLAAPAARQVGSAAVVLLCVTGASLAIWNAATPAASRPDWAPLAAALGPPEETRAITYSTAFVSPLILDLPDAYYLNPGETASVREIDLVDMRRVPGYNIGPCWWVATCGGVPLIGPPDAAYAFEVPRGWKLVEQGQTRAVHLQPLPGQASLRAATGPGLALRLQRDRATVVVIPW